MSNNPPPRPKRKGQGEPIVRPKIGVKGQRDSASAQTFTLSVAFDTCLLDAKQRSKLGKRTQQLTPVQGRPRYHMFHGSRSTIERVVVYDNGIEGLTPTEPLRAHPIKGVFASIGPHSLKLVKGEGVNHDTHCRVIVIENDPALPVPEDPPPGKAVINAPYDPATSDGCPRETRRRP